MEELYYHYFSILINYSTTTKPLVLIFSIIEINPFFSYFFENPYLLKKYINNLPIISNYENIKNNIRDTSLYYLFRQLKPNDKHLYPLVFILLLFFIIIFMFLFIFFFSQMLLAKLSNSSSKLAKQIIVSFLDHLLFRTLSIFFFEILINYICNYSNVFLLILFSLLFLFILFVHFTYYRYFRLCLKYDLNTKYIYDNQMMVYYDNIFLIIKIAICFDINVNNESISFFCNIFTLVLLIWANYLYIKISFVNFLSSIKGFYFWFLLILYVNNIVFTDTLLNISYCVFHSVLCFLLALGFVFFIRIYKVHRQITWLTLNNKNLYISQLHTIGEYYETSQFNYHLEKITFFNKIKYEQNQNVLLKNLLTFYIQYFKANKTKNNQCSSSFYYMIIKIIKHLFLKRQNNFKILFKTWKTLEILKDTNFLYYINLRYYYSLLCEEQQLNNDYNLLQFNESYFLIYKSVNQLIHNFEDFLAKKAFNSGQDFVAMAEKINIFQKQIKKNYNIILKSPIKDLYQEYLLQIIIECLLNEPLNRNLNTFLIEDQLMKNEELLDKQYNLSKNIIVRFDLVNMTSKIIKVGKEFIKYLDKNIEDIFPIELKDIAKKTFYKEIKPNEKLTMTNLSSEYFKFIIRDDNQNLKNILFLYKIFPNILKSDAYLDGFYQLGKEALIITEINGKYEYIVAVSKKLEKFLLLNQDFLNLLNHLRIRISFNDFMTVKNEISYNVNDFFSYLTKIKIYLTSMICKDDFKELDSFFTKISSDYQLVKDKIFLLNYQYTLTDQLKKKEFKIYQISTKTLEETRTLQTRSLQTNSITKGNNLKVSNNQNTKEGVSNSFFSNFDTNSVSSAVTSTSSAYTLKRNFSLRKQSDKKMSQSNHNVIVFFILLILGLSVFCLVYENELNSRLKNLVQMYKNTANVSRFSSMIIDQLFSFIYLPDSDGEFTNHYFDFLSRTRGYSKVYIFSMLYYQKNSDILSSLYSKFYKSISKENDFISFFTQNTTMLYMVYDNNSFGSSYEKIDTFDFNFLSFISKLSLVKENQHFNYSTLYPITLNETFFPVQFYDTELNVESLTLTQKYTYEIFLSYLKYVDGLLGLKNLISKRIINQIRKNSIMFVMIIACLTLSNIMVWLTSIILLAMFPYMTNKKLNFFNKLMNDEQTIPLIKNKFELLLELIKFYSNNPVKIISKLAHLMKNSRKNYKLNSKEALAQKMSTLNDKKKTLLVQINKTYDTGFVTKKFYIYLLLFLITFVAYFTSFYFVMQNKYKEVKNIVNVVFYSINTEDGIFIFTGLIQMLYLFAFNTTSLNSLVPNAIISSSEEENQTNYIELLLNQLHTNWENELILKEEKNYLPRNVDIINITSCDNYFDLINHTTFNEIFEEYSSENYKEQLIDLCKTSSSVENNSESLLTEEILYRITKLVLSNSEHGDTKISEPEEDSYLLLIQTIFFLQPIRKVVDSYYHDVILEKAFKSLFMLILGFSLGNFCLQLLNFVIIKFFIFDKIEQIDINLDELANILNCN